MKKRLPVLTSDKAAAGEFIAQSDLTEYDPSRMTRAIFEFQPKEQRVNLRISSQLLKAVRAAAARAGLPYQRLI